MQVHTGTGASDLLNMEAMNPVCLYDLFTDPRYLNKVKIVLLHGGYPYIEETGYLVAQFSHLYTDLSGTISFSSVGGAEIMRKMFERAPLNKVSYGSDSGGFPELAWFGSLHFKDQLNRVLGQLMDEGAIHENQAYEIAHKVLYDNALELYPVLHEIMSEKE